METLTVRLHLKFHGNVTELSARIPDRFGGNPLRVGRGLLELLARGLAALGNLPGRAPIVVRLQRGRPECGVRDAAVFLRSIP